MHFVTLSCAGRGVRLPYVPVSGVEFEPDERIPRDRAKVSPFPHHWPVLPNQLPEKPFVTRALVEPANNDPYERMFVPEMVPELMVPDLEGFKVNFCYRNLMYIFVVFV